jgi:hypothetical protein
VGQCSELVSIKFPSEESGEQLSFDFNWHAGNDNSWPHSSLLVAWVAQLERVGQMQT